MSTRVEVGAAILGVVVIGNLVIGAWGRRYSRRLAVRAAETSWPPCRRAPAAATDQGKATLVVERAAGYLRDALRLYVVVVDGRRAGKLASGGVLLLDVAAGTHVVQIKIDVFRSRRLSVDCLEASQVKLTCRPRDSSPLVIDDLILGAAGRRSWILLEEVSASPNG